MTLLVPTEGIWWDMPGYLSWIYAHFPNERSITLLNKHGVAVAGLVRA